MTMNMKRKREWFDDDALLQLLMPMMFSTERCADATEALPERFCVTCGRPFIWRKKWDLVWDEVKYCSDGCRQRAGRGREVADDVLRIHC